MCLPWEAEYSHRYDTYAEKVANVFRDQLLQMTIKLSFNLDQDVKDGVNDQNYYLRSFILNALEFQVHLHVASIDETIDSHSKDLYY
jgi:hypothetical protein